MHVWVLLWLHQKQSKHINDLFLSSIYYLTEFNWIFQLKLITTVLYVSLQLWHSICNFLWTVCQVVCSWHVYSRFWLHSMLFQTIGGLQHHQLYDCHSCQISHYSMSSQRYLHIYVMRLHCMGYCGRTYYLLKQLWHTMYLRKSEKWEK